MYSSGFKLIRVVLVMHGWLFKDIHFIWSDALTVLTTDPLKIHNGITAYLINLNHVLYYF